MKQGKTGLTVRELKLSQNTLVELSPKKVKAWLEELPIANLGETSQMVYKLLVSANSSILEPKIRNNILKLIEPTISSLVDALERQFVNHHIALTEKQRKIAALVQALQTELALGYHASIESILLDGVKFSNKKLLAQSICAATYFHSLVVFRCYLLYSPIPSRLWRELYQLYQFAMQFELTDLEVETSEKLDNSTIKNNLIRSLLLSTASPYQLKQSEMLLLWGLLPNYVKHCKFESHGYSNQLFYVNLSTATPPVQKSLYKETESNKVLKLDVKPALEILKINLAKAAQSDNYSARNTMIQRHLIHCWEESTQRNFARTKCDEPIDVSIGLGATHYLLTEIYKNKELDEPDLIDTSVSNQTLEAMEGSLKDATLSLVMPSQERERPKADRNYLSTSADTNQDIWAKLYRPHQATEQQDDNTPKFSERSKDSIVKESYQIQTCQLINMSPGGYCIQIAHSELPKHSQTGEIIGIIENESYSQQWSIGVVRWVRRRVQGDFIQMGIQLLAPDVVPINIQLRNSKGEKNATQRALLLPALTGVGQEATIVTNPLGFKASNKLKVVEQNKEYEVRLLKEVNSSGSAKQFSFEKLNASHSANNPSDRKPPSEDGSWDLI